MVQENYEDIVDCELEPIQETPQALLVHDNHLFDPTIVHPLEKLDQSNKKRGKTLIK